MLKLLFVTLAKIAACVGILAYVKNLDSLSPIGVIVLGAIAALFRSSLWRGGGSDIDTFTPGCDSGDGCDIDLG